MAEAAVNDNKPKPFARRVPAVAQELGVSERSVWRLLGSGKLQAIRIGRAVCVTVASIERYEQGLLDDAERASAI